MDRRELLKMVAALTGGVVIGGNSFLTGCKTDDKKAAASLTFNENDIAFLDEVADTILPTTKTPGAKAAKVGQFMTVMVNDCYEEKNQRIFHEGMGKLDDASKKKFDNSFVKLTPQQRHEMLVDVDKETKDYQLKKVEFDKTQNDKEISEKSHGNTEFKKEEYPPHYFVMMKQLTLLGYFTSEIGATQALRYVAVPGKYEGCIPYKKGDRAWA